jgi:hypothetical protein
MNVSRYFKEVVWKTREGRIVIYGSVINVAIGAASLWFPGIFTAKGIFAGLFLFMPVALMLMHIKGGYHDNFKPSLFNAAVLIAVAAIPLGLEVHRHVHL